MDEDQLLDYEEEQEETVDAANDNENGMAGDTNKKIKVRSCKNIIFLYFFIFLVMNITYWYYSWQFIVKLTLFMVSLAGFC